MPVTERLMYPFAKEAGEKLICAVSCRIHGNMSLVHGDTSGSLDNRKSFLNNFGIDFCDLICMNQVHGNRIKVVNDKDRGSGALACKDAIADTDALITNKADLPLAVFHADCLPVFLYSLDSPAIGLVHAGWRGTKENILGKTVELMRKEFNLGLNSLRAYLGPAIRECCYEVGEEFGESFSEGFLKKGDKYYLDLAQANRSQLLAHGLSEANIFDSKICTVCQNKGFFSYRKEGKSCGRMMSVVMLT